MEAKNLREMLIVLEDFIDSNISFSHFCFLGVY